MPEALGQRNDDEPANGFGRMQLNTQAIFEIVAPATYWVIALLWAIILALLLKRASIFRAQDDALKVLVVVLALDAFRTLVENIYFGTLFNSYFGLLPISFMKALESPMLLAMPKLVNIGTGILILLLIVRRWIPATDNERLQANIQQALEKKEWLDQLEAEQERLIRAQSVAKVGSWETNLTTLEATWSAEAFRIFEVDATSFVPSHAGLLSLMIPEDRRLMDEAFSRSLNTRDICTFEHRLVSADGRIKIVSERWRTFVDQRGVPSFALGTCQDLTEIRAAEAKAQDAIYQLRIAGNAALLGAWSYKVGDEHVEWSEQTASIHGMPAGFSPTVAEAIEFYAPEHRKKIENAFLACADSGKEFDETLEIVTPNGQRVWVRAIGEALLEKDGVVRKVHGAFQDITTLVANRKHLQFLETAISRISDIVMITEAEPINEPGPRIIFVNRSFEKLTGYSASEALGKTPRILQGKNTSRHELDRIRMALEQRTPVRTEIVNYTKSGSEYWLELDLTPIEDAAGNCTHFVAVERDITMRKAREAGLKEIASRIETLIEQAPLGIIVHHNFTPLIANNELARMFGYGDASEIMELDSCRTLFADDEQERIVAYDKMQLAGGSQTGVYSIKGKRKDGSIIELENRAFPIQWGDKLSVCSMLTDVSQQKLIEAQLRQSQRLEAVGQMTGGVAHDFNNLLTVILGNAEILEEELPDRPNLKKMAQLTREAAEIGADLTKRLLAFSRQQVLDPKITDLNDLIENSSPLLQRALGDAIELKLIQNSELWCVLIDAPQFESALMNLAVNGRDAMPNGGCLIIETSNVEFGNDAMVSPPGIPPGHYVCCSVTDTGTGMDEATRLRAFEPFYTTKDVGKGTGLGLSMVYGIVKQSRGHIRIHSELGLGTAFRIYLPRKDESVRPASLPTHSGQLTGWEKILVVEDNDLVRRLVTFQLQELGYEVVPARDGTEALAILSASADFHMLFTDVVMPGGISGPRLAEEALKIHPSLLVLFTSGYTENADIHYGQLDSSLNLLNKPYRRYELAERIRSVLDKSITSMQPGMR